MSNGCLMLAFPYGWYFLVPNLRLLLAFLGVRFVAKLTCTALLRRHKTHLYAASHLPSYPLPCPACLPLVISNAGGAHCTILVILLCFDGPRSRFVGPRSCFDRSSLVLGPYFDGPRSLDGPRSGLDGPRSCFDGPRSCFDGPRS